MLSQRHLLQGHVIPPFDTRRTETDGSHVSASFIASKYHQADGFKVLKLPRTPPTGYLDGTTGGFTEPDDMHRRPPRLAGS
jgi:hypothetical protein